jgi:hypothetical protein
LIKAHHEEDALAFSFRRYFGEQTSFTRARQRCRGVSLLTHIAATESVSLCKRMKSWNWNQRARQALEHLVGVFRLIGERYQPPRKQFGYWPVACSFFKLARWVGEWFYYHEENF